jgi:hypothetical protein
MADKEILRQVSAVFTGNGAATTPFRAAATAPAPAPPGVLSPPAPPPAPSQGETPSPTVVPFAPPRKLSGLAKELRDLLEEFQTAKATHAQAIQAANEEHQRADASVTKALETGDKELKAEEARVEKLSQNRKQEAQALAARAREHLGAATTRLRAQGGGRILDSAPDAKANRLNVPHTSEAPLQGMTSEEAVARKARETIEGEDYKPLISYPVGVMVISALVFAPLAMLLVGFLLGAFYYYYSLFNFYTFSASLIAGIAAVFAAGLTRRGRSEPDSSSPWLLTLIIAWLIAFVAIVLTRVVLFAYPTWIMLLVAVATAAFLVLNWQRQNQPLAEAYGTLAGAVANVERLLPQRERQIAGERDAALSAARTRHLTAREAQEATRRSETARHQSTISFIEQRFRDQLADLRARLLDFAARADAAMPAWAEPMWEAWQPSTAVPTVTRLGTVDTGAEMDHLAVPAVVPFPRVLPLLVEAGGQAKEAAMEGVEALLLRLLATLPPSKLHLTLFDPVGLGRNVAALMPLSDANPKLLNSRAWTETHQFEKYLNELTDRIAEVHQKFLRKEFQTIEEHNASAKVPQPYHILVVANFPAKFTEEAANRLLSVAEAGPACGVYTIVVVDKDLKPTHGINLDELRRLSTVLVADGNHFSLREAVLKEHPLTLDALPDAKVSTRMLQRIGELAEEAGRVEVPLAEVAPPPAAWWSEERSTASEIVVPIGLASATKEQRLALGKDTSQHVLIAGRTGSGKSTLLHVLIASLALTYSPEELQLYLIDFKKGVEFKPYAKHCLPHARVIAIETEREFGLSVLRGLDDEMTRRGELFRAIEDQNIAAYREATGAALPRLLLIVDEFQEFFTEDDAVAREAALVLDRLVRQGRAFGIHVLLGSQTLAGAYSLARSTMDQMGVRIALQCSETDSRLILSDDNPMARILSRAGEAIYNDQNGRPEGNHLFQTVWLNDDERGRYLVQLQELACARGYDATPIVFEGNAPADASENAALAAALDAERWPAPAAKSPAWLGEPIAIKEPTAAAIRRQSGSNLLIVGHNEEAAVGTLAATIASLAAQHPPDEAAPTFFLLDFTPVDAPYAGLYKSLLAALPHRSCRGLRRDVPKLIGEIAAEVSRRLEADDATAPPIYLIIHGLMRARDLRPDENGSFGPSAFRFDLEASAAPPPPSPAQQLPVILREGPDLGVHTLVWCDTAANLNRVLDPRALREFDLRVVFQMSFEDSNHLIGSPAASKLGPHRAIYYSEELSVQEKFRPYGPPPADWVASVGDRLRARGVPEVI